MTIRTRLLGLSLAAALSLPSTSLLLAQDKPAKPAATQPAEKHADALWVTDFEAAKAQAKKEGKDLLIDFTGSDWCIWCQRLHKEVFDTDAFRVAAPKNFVLVELDFPRKTALPEKLQEQNNKLAELYGIEGFPTVLLMKPSGEVYARTGYQKGGADAYLKHLEELRGVKDRTEKLFADAEKAGGVEKAKLLDEALATLEQSGADMAKYESTVEEIIKLDAKDEAGLKSKYEMGIAMNEVQGLIAQRQFADATKRVDKLVAEKKLKGELLQSALSLKAEAQGQSGDLDGCIATLEQAKAAAPDSEFGKGADDIIASVRAVAERKKKAASTKDE